MKKRLTSSIIISIFITIALIMIICFMPVNVHQMMQESMDSLDDTAEAKVIGGIGVGIAMAIVIVLFYAGAIASLIISLICLPFAIANHKSSLNSIKIYSFVLDGLCGLSILLCILKLILWSVGY